MPRIRSTRRVEDFSPPDMAEIQNRILEGGGRLALLIGKDFPIAEEVWPEVNQFHRMIDGYGLNDTWVTMVTPEDREVSNFALAFCLSFSRLLILYLVDCIADRYRLYGQIIHLL